MNEVFDFDNIYDSPHCFMNFHQGHISVLLVYVYIIHVHVSYNVTFIHINAVDNSLFKCISPFFVLRFLKFLAELNLFLNSSLFIN